MGTTTTSGPATKTQRALSIGIIVDSDSISVRRSLKAATRETAEEIADLKGSAGSKAPPLIRGASRTKGRRRALSIGHFADVSIIVSTNKNKRAGKKKGAASGASRKRALSIMDFADAAKAGIIRCAAKLPVGRKRALPIGMLVDAATVA